MVVRVLLYISSYETGNRFIYLHSISLIMYKGFSTGRYILF